MPYLVQFCFCPTRCFRRVHTVIEGVYGLSTVNKCKLYCSYPSEQSSYFQIQSMLSLCLNRVMVDHSSTIQSSVCKLLLIFSSNTQYNPCNSELIDHRQLPMLMEDSRLQEILLTFAYLESHYWSKNLISHQVCTPWYFLHLGLSFHQALSVCHWTFPSQMTLWEVDPKMSNHLI